MTYDDVHPTLRQLIGCHEGFRKAGFPAENLFVEPASNTIDVKPGEMMCFMRLNWRSKVFRVGCGVWPEDDWEGLRAKWTEACEAVVKGLLPQADWDRMWQESFIFKDKAGFVLALANKGIVVPRGLD